jgi:pectate lyase
MVKRSLGTGLLAGAACALVGWMLQAGSPAQAQQPDAPRTGADLCTPGTMITGTVDCQGRTIGTTCSGQSEDQRPVLELADGAVLMNLRLNENSADGIHCLGNCTLMNIVWEDVCEDAATMKGGPGTVMNIIGGSAANADDKVFQHNGVGSTINIMNFTTTGEIGKLYRSCGDCTGNDGPRIVNVSDVKLEKVKSAVVGVNSNFGDRATLRNVQIQSYEPGKPKVCQEFRGVVKGNGSSQSIGERFNSAACDVSTGDVTGF